MVARGQLSHAGDNGVVIGSHQGAEPGLDHLGALGRLASDQNPKPEGRSLFLDSARVAHHDPGPAEEIHEIRVLQRLQKPHIGRVA